MAGDKYKTSIARMSDGVKDNGKKIKVRWESSLGRPHWLVTIKQRNMPVDMWGKSVLGWEDTYAEALRGWVVCFSIVFEE